MYIKYLFSFCICVYISVTTCSAQVVLSEIMYDPDGTDTGREWIEIQNTSSQSVDLTKWKLYEEGVNHSFAFNDGPSIPAGAYAIITTDRNQFAKDYPNVQAKTIQASFSLKNTGESIGLKNEAGNLIEEYIYQVSLGGAGNGESIQKLSLGYAAGLATPGTENASVRAPEQPSTSTTSSTTSSNSTTNEIVIPSSQSPYRPWPSDRNVYVTGGGNRVVVAGADSIYEARALGIDKKPLENVNFYWTFGDGGTETGRSVRHYFRYPGTYVVLLDAISGDYISSDHMEVLVINPDIQVTGYTEGVDGYIEIKNSSEYELDLSGWVLETGGMGGAHFVFPKKSLILPHAQVKFPNDITKLSPTDKNIRILFPNSDVAFDTNAVSVKQTESVPTTISEVLLTSVKQSTEVKQEVQTPPVSQEKIEMTDTPKVTLPREENKGVVIETNPKQPEGSVIQVAPETQTALPPDTVPPEIYIYGFIGTLCVAAGLIWYAQKSGILTDNEIDEEVKDYDIIGR